MGTVCEYFEVLLIQYEIRLSVLCCDRIWNQVGDVYRIQDIHMYIYCKYVSSRKLMYGVNSYFKHTTNVKYHSNSYDVERLMLLHLLIHCNV